MSVLELDCLFLFFLCTSDCRRVRGGGGGGGGLRGGLLGKCGSGYPNKGVQTCRAGRCLLSGTHTSAARGLGRRVSTRAQLMLAAEAHDAMMLVFGAIRPPAS